MVEAEVASAVEIAVEMRKAAEVAKSGDMTAVIGVVFLAIGLIFVWRSFYAMRIPAKD